MSKFHIAVPFFSMVLALSLPLAASAESMDSLAKVGDVSITKALFEKRMSRLTNERQSNFSTYETKKELLDMLVATEVLHQEGKRLGLETSPAIKAQVSEFLESLLVREVVNLISRDKVTDGAMKAYYDMNKSDFGEVRASHVLLKTEEEALDVKKELDGGAVFSVVAKKNSIDAASAARGGDLGFFTKDRMVEPFATAAFAMKKKGEISAPIKSSFGYHIIQYVESREAGDFKTLNPTQMQNLRGMLVNFEIDQLKAKANISINDAALRAAANSPAMPSH